MQRNDGQIDAETARRREELTNLRRQRARPALRNDK
jgi:hypothetical protein